MIPRKGREDETRNAEKGGDVVKLLETESWNRGANAVWDNDESRNAEEKGANRPERETPWPGDLFSKSSTNEATKDVTRRSAKAEKIKSNILLDRKRRESSRQECKRVGHQSAAADTGHGSSKVEEDKAVRKAADERPNGHLDPSKDEDILVPKVVSQSSPHQDEDTTAK